MVSPVHRRCFNDEIRRCKVCAIATTSDMQVMGIRNNRHWEEASDRTEALMFDALSMQELLLLQDCCNSLMQSISDRLETISSSLKIENDTPVKSCSCTDKQTLHAPLSALLSGTAGSPTSGPGITAQHLDSDLGLWQALPQELFPSKRTSKNRSEFNSQEGSQQPTSPSMLSVATAPSDSGTIRFSRPAMELSSANSASRGAHAMLQLSAHDPYPFHPTCYTPHQDTEQDILSAQICDGTLPVTSHTAACDHKEPMRLRDHTSWDAPHPHIPVSGAALNAVPECNSSLETPDSCGHTYSSRMLKGSQSVLPCNSTLQSFKESPAEEVGAVPQWSRRTSGDGSASDSGNTLSYRNRGSSASSSQSARSQKSRRNGGGDTAPMVQYGFQSPQTFGLSASAVKLAAQSCDASSAQDPNPRLTVGTGARRKCGLLSASLSQCTSNCTSPHAVSPTIPPPALGLPSKLARLSFSRCTFDSSASPPRASAHSPSGRSLRKSCLFAVPSCSPIASYMENSYHPSGEPAGVSTTTASGCSLSAGSPVSMAPAVIPEALQVQMMSLGYHRPSRVFTSTK